jgi:hypothetical protein
MASDIVIQLRELASSTKRRDGRSTLYGAANEIEQLRKIIKDFYFAELNYQEFLIASSWNPSREDIANYIHFGIEPEEQTIESFENDFKRAKKALEERALRHD